MLEDGTCASPKESVKSKVARSEDVSKSVSDGVSCVNPPQVGPAVRIYGGVCPSQYFRMMYRA